MAVNGQVDRFCHSFPTSKKIGQRQAMRQASRLFSPSKRIDDKNF